MLKCICRKCRIDIDSLIQESWSNFSEIAAAKSVGLSTESTGLNIIGDRERLGQALLNYISNAIKFSPADSQVKISCSQSESELIVRVQDQGAGINAAEQPRIFEKFYQAKSSENHSGFGVGLSIVKMLVNLHGGQVGFSSRPSAGSTFWFSVPLDEAAVE